MNLQELLEEKKISRYQLSKMSGVPKTTILDLCSGRSNVERCSAKTVRQLSYTLGVTMEEFMELFASSDSATGLPQDEMYFECDLPLFLSLSIEEMKRTLKKMEQGDDDYDWDIAFCDLQSSINIAEVEQIITPDQAWLLREKYLGIERV